MAKYLITGGTGFVGGHLAATLAEAGHDVVITGRHRYRYGRLFHPNIRFRRAELNSALTSSLCEGCDGVFHVGALSTPWGRESAFFDVNVEGTKRVIEGCQRYGVKRLVHVSSTSVFFSYRDRPNLPDDAPLADPFCNAYAASKAEAEACVQRAVGEGLNAIIIRARAVYGPGDTTLLPRILRAAQSGRLKQIGEGENALDFTYVANLVDALVLAIDHGKAGAALTVTDGAPQKVWPFLRDICTKVGVMPPSKQISWPKMRFIAKNLERVFRRLPGHPEPPVTEYGAGLLATTQTFDISGAARELGYKPRVSVAEGVSRTVQAMEKQDEGHAKVHGKLRFIYTGFCTNWQHHVLRTKAKKKVPFHCMALLFEHPEFGRTLIDTGYASHFHESTRRFPFSLYAKITPVQSSTAQSAAAQLAKSGIDPDSIDRVLITHFHGDHVAGLRDFKNADFICTRTAWDSVKTRGALRSLMRAHVPSLLPNDFVERLYVLDDFIDAGLGPFGPCHDLFGDGSLRLVSLPGHAEGHIGALAQVGESERKLLIADAVWTTEAYRERILPHPITRFIISNHAAYVHTIDKIRDFAKRYPDIDIIPNHCPEVFERYGPSDTKITHSLA